MTIEASIPSPTGPAAPVPGPQEELTNPAHVASATTFIKGELAKGRISPEAANAAFDELQTPPEQREPDRRTDDQKQIDQHLPPAKAEDFALRMYPPGTEPPVVPQEVRAFESTARGWLVDAGFPRENGNALIGTIEKAAQTTKAMTPDQLESYRQTELLKMQRIHGEKLPERLALADDMIDELEQQRPGLKNLLGSIGVGKTAMVWNLLIQHAEIYHARRGR